LHGSKIAGGQAAGDNLDLSGLFDITRNIKYLSDQAWGASCDSRLLAGYTVSLAVFAGKKGLTWSWLSDGYWAEIRFIQTE